MELRDYQEEALDRIGRASARGIRRQLGVAATGLGKTIVFCALAERMGVRTLVIAHRDELIEQAAAKVREVWPGVDVGVVKGSRNEVHATVVVASVQTLSRPKRLAELLAPTVLDDAPQFGLVVIDECFPAGTLVGGRPIESLRVGDLVPSWDEATGSPVERRVTGVMSRPASKLVTLHLHGAEVIRCTPNHPLMTRAGWIPAGLIGPGDDLLSFTHHAAADRDDLHRMPDSGNDRVEAPTGLVHAQRSDVLLTHVPRHVGEPLQCGSHGRHEPASRLRADDSPQPDAPAWVDREDEGHTQVHRAQTARSWWQRLGADRAASLARRAARLARRGHRADRPTPEGRPSHALQDRHRRRSDESGGRDRWAVPLGAGPPRVRSTQGRVADWRRVARVEVHERGGPGGLGADRTVYNLEVEGTQTYLVGSGVVAHNCHHSAAKSYRDLMHGLRCDEPDGPLLLGVTATPDRGDGKGLDDLFDEITFSYDIRWGIAQAWLSDLRGKRVRLAADFGALKVTAGDYNQGQAGQMLEDANAPEMIVRAWQRFAPGRRTLVFTPTVELAKMVTAEFGRAGVRAASVDGAMPIDERRDVLARYSRGDIDVVANCMVLTEGYDEPRTDCIVVARPTKSRALYTQMVGRGTRVHPEKRDCLVIDVVGATEVHDLVTCPSLFGIERPEKVWDDDGMTATEALREQVEEHAAAGRLLASEARLFDKVRDKSRLAWVTVHRPGQQRRYELDMFRKGQAVMVEITPDRWRAGWRTSVDGRTVKRVLIDDVSLELAQGVAEDLCRKLGVDKAASTDARWRKGRPTLKQREFAAKLHIDVPVGCTAGDLSELINTRLAQRHAGKPVPVPQPD